MIKTEKIGNRIRTYSDAGMMIRQVETGILYAEAVDVPGRYTYEETDIPVPDEDITAEEALDIITGGSEHEQTESD